jgi:hypothetical protein
MDPASLYRAKFLLIERWEVVRIGSGIAVAMRPSCDPQARMTISAS